MKLIKKIFKSVLYFLLIPITYLLVSFILTAITVNRKDKNTVSEKSIFLNTNGIHLDIIIPKTNLSTDLFSGIKCYDSEDYLSFGWGDKDFYLNTPTWGDLTFNTAFKAMFLKSSTLVHVTRYRQKHPSWIEINVDEYELQKLNSYISSTFRTNKNGIKILLENKGYNSNDDFYESNGNYNCFNTCNSWVNNAFKKSGLKSCLWTPFDFGLINKYE